MRQVQERWRVRVYILGSQYTTSTSLTSPHCLPTHTHDCHHLCVTWYTCTRGPHLRVLRPHTHTPTCVSCAPPPRPPPHTPVYHVVLVEPAGRTPTRPAAPPLTHWLREQGKGRGRGRGKGKLMLLLGGWGLQVVLGEVAVTSLC